MQIHQLKSIHKPRKFKRVGRGGKKGHYSGRGMKGQKARAGANFEPRIRELFKRYPKLRGYRFKKIRRKQKITIVNLTTLEKKFNPGEKVSPEILLEKKIISRIKGKMPIVKILGRGEITKALTFEDCSISKQAKGRIGKAGGQIKLKTKREKQKTTTEK